MTTEIIHQKDIEIRRNWVDRIQNFSGSFSSSSEQLQSSLSDEVRRKGLSNLLTHLRLCGNIPEEYHHDSSEEKLYSKYTDCLLSLSYQSIGLESLVLVERSDVADVEAVGKEFSFVADAKAFRLSRTAKNQKDFKVQAMDRWKHGKPYAMVVAPIYQLPRTTSQIYLQAANRNVCIFTYSHLSLLTNYAAEEGKGSAEELLFGIFKTVEAMNPNKSALDYWQAVNRFILGFSTPISELWRIEKRASEDSIAIAKHEDLRYLAKQRESILRMSREDAVKELLRLSKIEKKVAQIEKISDNGLFSIQ